jgi:hypothetical protein
MVATSAGARNYSAEDVLLHSSLRQHGFAPSLLSYVVVFGLGGNTALPLVPLVMWLCSD